MSFRSRRKSSGHGSSFMSTRRRSSATQRELEQLIHKRQRWPDWLTGLLMLVAPAALIMASIKTLDEQSAIESFFSPAGPLLVLLLLQIQLFFLWHLPANELLQVTEEGHPLKHRATAFESCLLICLLYLLGALIGLYPGQMIFLNWPSILATLCLICLLLLLLLFLCLRCPEDQRGHSLISQLFYGRHLQPVLLNVDIKAFVTSRLALTLWALYLLSAIFEHQRRFPKSHWPSLPLMTTSGLQLIYVLRRQWFEHLHTGVDNRNDRAGFYRLWAVLGLLPFLYLLPITIGAQQQEIDERPLPFYACLFLFGIGAQMLNTGIDRQRHTFREKEGQMKLMGAKDPYYICAKFRRENGETGTGLLLGSGYWSLCRHPNYAAEMCTFLFWTLPWTDPIVYLPFALLCGLLWWRMRRDELRCSIKYGQFWSQHCQKVPHLLLPGIY